MAKGANFERQIAKQLSRWWTSGERDDVFWRSQNSGGRATSRAKSGKGTIGQYGDIAATDKCGNPLLQFTTIELKVGYPRASIHALIDGKPDDGPNEIIKMIDQAAAAATRAGSAGWWLIFKRDRREPVLVMPSKMLCGIENFLDEGDRFIRRVSVYYCGYSFVVVSFAEFIELVHPDHIAEAHEWII